MRFVSQLSFEAQDGQDANLIIKAVKQVLAEHGVKCALSAPLEAIAAADDLVRVYTDGGCDTKKNGIGAWAYLTVTPSGDVVEKVGGFAQTTNNRMEMMAFLQAMEDLPMGIPYLFTTDSEYVMKGLTLWHKNWERNGWRNNAGLPVKNRDLWERLLVLMRLHTIKIEWTKGHADNIYNNRVDELCTQEMTKLHAAYVNDEFVQIDGGGPAYVP